MQNDTVYKLMLKILFDDDFRNKLKNSVWASMIEANGFIPYGVIEDEAKKLFSELNKIDVGANL